MGSKVWNLFAASLTVAVFTAGVALTEDELLPMPPPPAAMDDSSAATTDSSASPVAPAASSTTDSTDIVDPFGSDSSTTTPAAEPIAPATSGWPTSSTADSATSSSDDPFASTTSSGFTPTSAAGGIPGRIVGGNVNIRTGNSTNYEIIVTLNPDTPVTVYGKNGDWVQIAYPSNQPAYVSLQYIDGEIPVEIPALGIQRTIKGSRVTVRFKSWPGSTVVGYVEAGDVVTVTGIRGQYARIQPPVSARAWVFGKYVRYSGDVQMAEPEPLSASLDKGKDKPKSLKDVAAEAKKTSPKIDVYRQIAKREKKQLEQYRESVDQEMDELDKKLAEIEADAEAEKQAMLVKKKEILTPMPKEDVSVPGKYSGWVEYIGFVGQRPAAYRLVKGGQVMFLLRSAKYDLADYQYKRVLVSGRVELAPGWEANILVVDQIDLLGTTTSGVVKTPTHFNDFTEDTDVSSTNSRTSPYYGGSVIDPNSPFENKSTSTATTAHPSDGDSAGVVEPETEGAQPTGELKPIETAPLKIEPPVETYESRYQQ